jgi:Protein of unknown function (DUF3164).
MGQTEGAAEATMRNALGQDVPVSLVKEVDQLRDGVVMDLVTRFARQRNVLMALKKHTVDEIETFLKLSAERFKQDVGGKKGNVTLYSYDGRYKVVRSVSDNMVFDEGLSSAKNLIDQCLTDWGKGSRPETRLIIDRAFRPNTAGRVSTSAILSLRTLAINDPRWIMAMHAISESLKAMSSKAYYRVFEKDENDKWRPICIDFAAL